MTAPGQTTVGNVGEWIAERHESDVTAILTELRRPERLIDEVIEQTYRLQLERGEVTAADHSDFVAWARQVLAQSRSGAKIPTNAGWSESLQVLLPQYLKIASSKRTTPDNVAARAAEAQSRVPLDQSEREISEAVAGVLVGSVTMWSSGGPGGKEVSGEKQVNAVLRSDIMGAITGAAATAVTGGGALGGAAAGAVLGSAVEAVLQSNASDAIEDAEPNPDPAPEGH
jgi:hypothetical protein